MRTRPRGGLTARGALTYSPGELEATILVPIRHDDLDECDRETLSLKAERGSERGPGRVPCHELDRG